MEIYSFFIPPAEKNNKSRYLKCSGLNYLPFSWKCFFRQFFKEVMLKNNTYPHQEAYI